MQSASLTLVPSMSAGIVHLDNASHAGIDGLEHGHLGAKRPRLRADADAELRWRRGLHRVSLSVRIGERHVQYPIE
jgi:hypothetical protein